MIDFLQRRAWIDGEEVALDGFFENGVSPRASFTDQGLLVMPGERVNMVAPMRYVETRR